MFKSVLQIIYAIALVSCTPSNQNEIANEYVSGVSGDRHPEMNCIYPEEAFLHNGKGGNVLDITQPPFNAKGDGISDDTEAFVKAYDFVLTEQDKIGYSGTAMLNTEIINPNREGYPIDGELKTPDASFIIYIPNGEYLVSSTIIYSMKDRTPSKRRDVFFKGGEWKEINTGWERLIWIRFVGQNRDKTIIRLKDNSEGFEAGQEKAVLSFGKSPFNNRKGMNVVKNLTINTGKANPGAVALDYTSANKGQLRNLTLKSEDGAGSYGILFHRPPVIGYHSDITVEGFDYGICSEVGHACAPVLEYITLKKQNKAGILLTEKETNAQGHGEAMVAARFVKSENRVPAVIVGVEGGHLILDKCDFQSDNSEAPAIDLQNGELFARNIYTKGYEVGIQHKGEKKIFENNKIDEFVSGKVFYSEGQTPKSLNLSTPVIAPEEWPKSADEWATPYQFGALGNGEADDTEAIQAAFNSGKPYIFLTQPRYKVSAPIKVPATIKYIDGMFRHNPDLQLVIAEDSDTPVRMGYFYRCDIVHDSPRTFIADMAQNTYKNTINAKSGTFISLNGSYPRIKENPAKIDYYGWSTNNEGSGLPIVCDGAKSWIYGFKVERGPVLEVKNGGSLEILGATIGVRTPDENAIINNESNLCLVANKSAGEWGLDAVAIKEMINGKETLFMAKDLPPRTKAHPEYPVIPMYVGRK